MACLAGWPVWLWPRPLGWLSNARLPLFLISSTAGYGHYNLREEKWLCCVKCVAHWYLAVAGVCYGG